MDKLKTKKEKTLEAQINIPIVPPVQELERGMETPRTVDLTHPRNLKGMGRIERQVSEQAKPTVERTFYTSPTTSVTHRTLEPLAQARADRFFLTLPEGRSRACDNLEDDRTSLEGAYEETSKFCDNNCTRHSEHWNTSKHTNSPTIRQQPDRLVREGPDREERGAAMSKGVAKATQGDTSTFSSTPQTLPNNADDNLGNKYHYTSLPGPGWIRLLRLMPNKDENAPIQCQLLNYPLQEFGEETHPYEALSYVWGNSKNPKSISIDSIDIDKYGLPTRTSLHAALFKYNLTITTNLHKALLHLRGPFFERILWVDAICINQGDNTEKAGQIQYMAEIYSKASRVIVWLGPLGEVKSDSDQTLKEIDSDQALEGIRLAADEMFAKSSLKEPTKQAILALLQQPWFERIWVLQEVASARNIIIRYGSTEIDGYAFCLGLQSLELSYGKSDPQGLIRSATYLIRRATFRPKKVTMLSGKVFLEKRPLSELIDMYHTREATRQHDKVFALLGMSSDDTAAAGLLPDYEIKWEDLLEKLVKFLLCGPVSVETWAGTERAIIGSKGCILGRVSSINTDRYDRQKVGITFKDASGWLEPNIEWTLQATAKSIKVGDLVCFLEGAPEPTVIRLCWDYFAVIMVAATPQKDIGTGNGSVGQPRPLATTFPLEFLLIWDWERFREEDYETLMRKQVHEHWNREVMTRLWKVALILEDMEEYREAEVRLLEIVKSYGREFGEEDDLPIVTVKDKLAVIYKKMKRWEKAKKLFEQVIQTRQKVQGLNHPDTVSSMADLASAYRGQNNLNEAEKLELMIVMLKRRRDGEQITEEEVVKIARSSERPMKLLLDQRGSEIQITEGVIAAAARNGKSGKAVIKLLLDQRGSEIQITEGVVTAAAGNEKSGKAVMKLLLGRRRSEVQITEGGVAKIAKLFDEEVMRLLLDQRESKVQITERVVTAAAGNQKSGKAVMGLLLDRRGSEVQITEHVVRAAAGNWWNGIAVMKLLLDQRGSEVQITEDVAAKIIKLFDGEVRELVLGRRGSRLQKQQQ